MCRRGYADIYVQVFVSFLVYGLGERFILRTCLGILSIGPGLGVHLRFSRVTLRGLTAVHKHSQTAGLRGRREKTQTSLLGRGSSPGSAGFVHRPLLARLAVPRRGAAAGEGANRQHR